MISFLIQSGLLTVDRKKEWPYTNKYTGELIMFSVIILKNNPVLTKDEYAALLFLVSPEKQERIKKFHFEQDAQNCLLGDVLVRMEICHITSLSNKQLEFSVNEYGKPFLVNNPRIHFNISHSGNYIACAIDDEPVGADIELLKTANMKIADRFFTADETTYIKKINQNYRFFEIWTKKESYIKWEGKGLSKPLTSFSVFNTHIRGSLYFHNVYFDGSALCYVCTAKKTKPKTTIMGNAEFLSLFRR